jgi:hypothetical protein
MNNPQIEGMVQRIIEANGLNPAIETGPNLQRALGISQVTRWRIESRLGIKPDCRVSRSSRFDTTKYLVTVLSENTEAAA